MRPALPGLAIALTFALPRAGHAQYDDIDFEVPSIVFDTWSDEGETEDTSDIDMANLVQVAARRVTTVQEAPAIVTVLTAAQIERTHATTLREVMDRIPGWMTYGANHSQFPSALTRGTFQAVLLLRDGLSTFEPTINFTNMDRGLPLETIKRIEVITGPGGVLWGANSFLGVINVVSKDANDINGVEASADYSLGSGDSNGARGYVMAGIPDFKQSGTDIFLHTSFESFESPHFTMPGFLYHSPAPQPNSALIYGPLNTAEPARSMLLSLNGSVIRGNLQARFALPFGVANRSLTFAGAVVNERLPQDDLPECQSIPDGGAIDTPPCIDRGKVSRKSGFRFYDRFASLKWSDRFGRGRSFGASVHAYLVQFVRHWDPIQVMPAIATILPGGLGFAANNSTYRTGMSYDGDLDFGTKLRVVYGAEAFYEWLPDRTNLSRQGAGTEAVFAGPYNLELLPIACPNRAEWDAASNAPINIEKIEGCPITQNFASDRTTFGAYTSLQSALSRETKLEAGIRAQVAPGALGNTPYDTQLLGAAALVHEFYEDWHVKLNFTQGFRPPVWNNTAANGEAVTIPGLPGIVPETSQAYQVEVNARIKNLKRIREINLRGDYSYTILDNLITFPEGVYDNQGTRAIHSAELLSQLYFTGDHYLQLGYTWLRGTAEDFGQMRTLPEQWFNLALVSKVSEALELTAALRVVSSFEDPNRMVEYRNLTAGDDGVIQIGDPNESVVVNSTQLVLDRIPPSGMLQFGAHYLASDRLELRFVATNAMNALYYQPDVYSSYSPRLDNLPNPYAQFSARLSATYRY